MNKLIYVLAAGLLSGHVHAQLLQLGAAANVNAGAALGSTVGGATQAVGTATRGVRNTAGDVSAGARASLAAPAADAEAHGDMQVGTGVHSGADTSTQMEAREQPGARSEVRTRAYVDERTRAEARGRARQQGRAIARGADAAEIRTGVQGNANTSVITPRSQDAAGADARLSGYIQGR